MSLARWTVCVALGIAAWGFSAPLVVAQGVEKAAEHAAEEIRRAALHRYDVFIIVAKRDGKER